MDTILVIQFWAYARHPRSFHTSNLPSANTSFTGSSPSIIHPLSIPDGTSTPTSADTRKARFEKDKVQKKSDSWDQYDEVQVPKSLKRVSGQSRSTSATPIVPQRSSPTSFLALTAVMLIFSVKAKVDNGMTGRIIDNVSL